MWRDRQETRSVAGRYTDSTTFHHSGILHMTGWCSAGGHAIMAIVRIRQNPLQTGQFKEHRLGTIFSAASEDHDEALPSWNKTRRTSRRKSPTWHLLTITPLLATLHLACQTALHTKHSRNGSIPDTAYTGSVMTEPDQDRKRHGAYIPSCLVLHFKSIANVVCSPDATSRYAGKSSWNPGWR